MKSRFLSAICFSFILLAGCATAPPKIKETASKQQVEKTAVSSPTKETISKRPDRKEKTEETDPPDQPQKQTEPVRPQKPALSTDERERLVFQFMQGALLEEKNQYDEAGKAYAKALKIVPDSSYLGAMTGKALLQSGQTDKAIQVAEDAIAHGTNEVEAYRVLASAYRQKKELDRAIQYFKKLLEIEPDSIDTLNELVSLYVRTKHFENAIEIYRKMSHLDVYQSFMYQFRIALLLTQMGRYEEALEEYKNVAKQVPNNVDVYIRIAKLHEILNQNDDAIIVYLNALQYIRNSQDEISIRSALGPLYVNRKSYREAIHQYSRLKSLTPDDRQSIYQLAILYFEQEQFSDALRELNYLLEKSPGNFFFAIQRLQTMEKLDRVDEGYYGFLKDFDSAIENDSEENVQRFCLEIYRKSTVKQIESLGKLTYTQQLLETWLTEHPSQTQPLFVIAKIHIVQNNDGELIHDLQKIVSALKESQKNKDEEFFENLLFEIRSSTEVRRAFSTHNLCDELVETLQACTQEFPENQNVNRAIASIYMDSSRWTEAETQLLLVKENSNADAPDYKDVLYQLALVYDKMDRLADIERLMKEAIEEYPEDPQGYNYLGYTYADRNIRMDEAVRLIQKALKLSPDDGNILDSMGWAYYRMGRVDDAIEYLERAAEKEKNHPVILDHLGDARSTNGDRDAAIAHWKKVLEHGPDYPYDFTPDFQQRVMQKIQEAEKIKLP